MSILSVFAATINLFATEPVQPIATSAYSTFLQQEFMVSEMTEIAPLYMGNNEVRRWDVNGWILHDDELVWLA